MLWKCFLERAGYVRNKSIHYPLSIVAIVFIRIALTTLKRPWRLGLLTVSFPHRRRWWGESLVLPHLPGYSGWSIPAKLYIIVPPLYMASGGARVYSLWKATWREIPSVQLWESGLTHWEGTIWLLWGFPILLYVTLHSCSIGNPVNLLVPRGGLWWNCIVVYQWGPIRR